MMMVVRMWSISYDLMAASIGRLSDGWIRVLLYCCCSVGKWYEGAKNEDAACKQALGPGSHCAKLQMKPIIFLSPVRVYIDENL